MDGNVRSRESYVHSVTAVKVCIHSPMPTARMFRLLGRDRRAQKGLYQVRDNTKHVPCDTRFLPIMHAQSHGYGVEITSSVNNDEVCSRWEIDFGQGGEGHPKARTL